MVDVVSESLPYLADRAMIQRTLEECKGSIDNAVSKLLDAEERWSVSSGQGSSSVEREQDSDDDELSGPNKKQDRRFSRATQTAMKESEAHRRRNLALRPKHSKPMKPNNDIPHKEDEKEEKFPKYEDSDETEEEDWRDTTFKDSDNTSTSASASTASDYSSTTESRPKSNGVKLKLSQPKREIPSTTPTTFPSNNNNSTSTPQHKHHDPKSKRLTQRDKKDLKKAAQKAAQKERRQGVAADKAGNGTAAKRGGVSLVKTGKENTPVIVPVIRTLYI